MIHKIIGGSRPRLAVLVDPDKYNADLVRLADKSGVSCFLVGGSKLSGGTVHDTIVAIKRLSRLPVFIFPGDETQLSPRADGLLLLSLVSGRDPEYLIEKHVRAAPVIRRMKLQCLPTAYLLINGGISSTTQTVTKTRPLPANDRKKIAHTALAAEQLGFGAIYLEAGSGATRTIGASLIRLLKKTVSLPLIVGGGINTARHVKDAVNAGAAMVVVGNALEKNIRLLPELCDAVRYAGAKSK